MPESLKAILSSGAVWAAFIALLNGLIAYFLPDFPQQLLVLANALVAAILGAIGIQGVRVQVRSIRAQRAAGVQKPPPVLPPASPPAG